MKIGNTQLLRPLFLLALGVYCLEFSTPQIANQGGTTLGENYYFLEHARGPILWDVHLYDQVMDQMHRGESYYRASASLHYAYRFVEKSQHISPLSIRPPWLILLLSRTPRWLWLAVLWMLAGATCLLLAKRRKWSAIVLLLSGPYLLMLHVLWGLEFEVWAGLWIGLSAAFYLNGFRYAGAVTACIAIVCREIALPYFAVRLWFAWRDRQRHGWRELAVLLAGLSIIAAAWLLHIASMYAAVPEVLGKSGTSWLHFIGMTQVMTMIHQSSAVLCRCPGTLSGVFLFFLLGGLAFLKRMALEEQRCVWAAMAFVVFLCCVGHHRDLPWGYMAMPLWSIAAADGGAQMVRWLVEKRDLR